MAVGNTFCATAISSYAGFWIALAITFTPGGFAIISTIESAQGLGAFYDSFAFFLFVCEPVPFFLLEYSSQVLRLFFLADSKRKPRAGLYSQLLSSLPRSARIWLCSSSSLPLILYSYCSGPVTCTGMPTVAQTYR